MELANNSIQHSMRLSIRKNPAVDVPTAIFLDQTYNKVSAIIGCSRSHMLGNKRYMNDDYKIDEKHYLEDEYFLAVVHNPLALNPCPPRIFGNFAEYILEEGNDSWGITRIR